MSDNPHPFEGMTPEQRDQAKQELHDALMRLAGTPYQPPRAQRRAAAIDARRMQRRIDRETARRLKADPTAGLA